MIIANDKILYLDAFKDGRVNSINRAYWYRIIKKYTQGRYCNDWNKYFSPTSMRNLDDSDAPIFMYYNQELNKCIRIIQYNPALYESKNRYKQYLTTWLSKITVNNQPIPELVICLLLTHNNSYNAEQLIDYWINNKTDALMSKIKIIYQEQKSII